MAGQHRETESMGGWVLHHPGSLSSPDLDFRWRADVPRPEPGPGEVLLKVRACGVCHTDLHIVEGDLALPGHEVIPGHQVVGEVEVLGASAKGEAQEERGLVPVPPGINTGAAAQLITRSGGGDSHGLRIQKGTRVGVPWLYQSCGTCRYCRAGQENLCEHPAFTGFSHNGGYAERMVGRLDFLVPIPRRFSDEEAAPLLCAGIIGYRSLHLAGVRPGTSLHLGLFGFGASAHLTLQLARYWGHAIYVFSRSPRHRRLALELGATWAGAPSDRPPILLDAAITFAPVGSLIPIALRALARGGILAINAVHLDDVPAFPYQILYGERVLRSVANATRRDAWEWMYWADVAGVKPQVETFSLQELPGVLQRLKKGEVQGGAVVKLL